MRNTITQLDVDRQALAVAGPQDADQLAATSVLTASCGLATCIGHPRGEPVDAPV